MGRALPLPSSRVPRSRRSSARGSRRLPRSPSCEGGAASGTDARDLSVSSPRGAPRPPRPRRSPRGTLSTGPRSCCQPQISPVLHRAPIIEVAPDPDVPVPPQVRVEHSHELVDRSPAPIAPVGEPCLGAADEAPAPRIAGAALLPDTGPAAYRRAGPRSARDRPCQPRCGIRPRRSPTSRRGRRPRGRASPVRREAGSGVPRRSRLHRSRGAVFSSPPSRPGPPLP